MPSLDKREPDPAMPQDRQQADRLSGASLLVDPIALDTPSCGLTAGEAARRLRLYGANRIEQKPKRRLILNFLSRFRNPLVLVLLAAAAISGLSHESAGLLIIVVIVLLSVTLDFIQERGAEVAADRLRERVALKVTTVRDGDTVEIPASEIVPGDLIVLVAGDLVPADCRLVEAKDLFVNEALLTGESYPAEKGAGPRRVDEGAQAGTDESAVFMGSSVVSGIGRAVTIATGRNTQLGHIAAELHKTIPPTAFELGIRDFGLMIVRLTVLLVLFVLLVNILFARPLMESFLFALALAVGLTPELLPMIMSVTLAQGATRLSAKDVIVKRLSAIHDLGSMDVLCSDKTGTLTEAHIKLIREVDLEGAPSPHVLELAYLNAAFETGLKSPLDQAILDAAPTDLSNWRKIDEVPFDFERRRVSVLVEQNGRRMLVVKGAPEDVLKLSTYYQRDSDSTPLAFDAAAEAKAQALFQKLGGEGFRVLGIAWRHVDAERDHAHISDEEDLVFAGFAAFLDPPKDSARTALAALGRLNVAVKIVTGDNERVTEHVCRELGLPVTGVLSGPELVVLTDEALMGRLDQVNLFCRVNPAQKARIIRALRRRGHVVGYLGDGINDAPPLHASDVGFSVEGAADVAKEAATMILLRRDLSVIAEGVREGRRTFANIMKYVMMGTSSNFGNMFSMAGGVLFLPFLPMMPIQILLNNLLYDLSELGIPLDDVDGDMVERPRHWDMKFVRDFMLFLGPVSSLFDFLTFGVLLWLFHAGPALFQTGWFVESLMTQVLVIFIIRTRGSAFKSFPNRILAFTSLSAVAAAIVLPYSPAAHWLGFAPLPADLLITLVAITAIYLLMVHWVKSWFYAVHPLSAIKDQRALGLSHMS